MINIQPIEKIEHTGEPDDGGLDVHSIFPTIQGEGPYVGQPAIFIRLAGCNLQCPLCDTEYTAGRVRLSVPVIFDTVQEHIRLFAPLIVITGGEPFRQRNLGALVRYLIKRGFRVQIETNGSAYRDDLPYHDPDFTIVCSPKTGKLHRLLEENIDHYKYIIKDGDVNLSDGLPNHALDHTASPRLARPRRTIDRSHIYVQPCDTQDAESNAKSLQAAIKSCRDFGYTLCLQTHKLINLP
jgi:7-carboxy-7-deazaguanine synthase